MAPRKSVPKKTLVMKFGGTSVGSLQAMRLAASLVHRASLDWPRLVVVTSAMAGVTDLLLESAARAAAGDLSAARRGEAGLQHSHHAVLDSLGGTPERRAQAREEVDALIGEFRSLVEAIAVLGEATPRALDAVASLGERMSARLLAAAVEAEGTLAQAVDATALIRTDDRFQNAHPFMKATHQAAVRTLEPLLRQGKVPVVTGFIGATAEGVTTTLGRGGSDYSAAILGAALSAADVWIWTDVDGVMTADPRLVPGAISIPELSTRELAELAYFGAKVLHPKIVQPVVDAGIGLRICNTLHPEHPGTRLVAASTSGSAGSAHVAKAVTAIRRQVLLTVEGRGMIGVPGVAARTFSAVASTGTSVALISQASSEQSICFTVPDESARPVLAALKLAFADELSVKDIDRVWATDDVAIITVVGEGMSHTPGVAGRVFGALGERGINVIAIAQGSSEVSISLVVADGEAEAAVRGLHALIVDGRA
jgi:aspartokinase/homoserine dehydrogenase 1